MVLTEQKRKSLEKISDKNGVISALAFDQRGALKRLMAQYQDTEPTVAQMEELKVLVADELTKYASSMLLDPEYGLPATKALDKEAGSFNSIGAINALKLAERPDPTNAEAIKYSAKRAHPATQPQNSPNTTLIHE